jgi:hypothetical protein
MLSLASCVQIDDAHEAPSDNQKKLSFDISVTREGQPIPGAAVTRSSARSATVESGSRIATMNTDLAFGLVAVDPSSKTLVLDNHPVYGGGQGYSSMFSLSLWEMPEPILFSAYYPYVDAVGYSEDYESYSIPYKAQDTEAGPLVSKTVERAISQLNMLPLVFQHITNDIGFKICDVTPAPELQGLIHLRKLTATNVASSGIFTNDIQNSTGTWHRQAYYRKVVVFEGDAKVGVGSDNEKFVGYETLEDRLRDSHRYYSIPDEIEIGKQCVEVVYDVESFTLHGYTYSKLEGQTAKYMLYGLLPGNVFEYGKQYTFHIGLDLSSVYRQITFTPTVSEWETKIYENNDDF